MVKSLSATTHEVFFIWLGIAVISYFGYGMHNSRLNQAATER
ncbi:MAG: hypothetical protein ACYC7B_15330 [Burkholderiales bacterium]